MATAFSSSAGAASYDGSGRGGNARTVSHARFGEVGVVRDARCAPIAAGIARTGPAIGPPRARPKKSKKNPRVFFAHRFRLGRGPPARARPSHDARDRDRGRRVASFAERAFRRHRAPRVYRARAPGNAVCHAIKTVTHLVSGANGEARLVDGLGRRGGDAGVAREEGLAADDGAHGDGRGGDGRHGD